MPSSAGVAAATLPPPPLSTSSSSSSSSSTSSPEKKSPPKAKRPRLSVAIEMPEGNDRFCWKCHVEDANVPCTTCQRSFHEYCIPPLTAAQRLDRLASPTTNNGHSMITTVENSKGKTDNNSIQKDQANEMADDDVHMYDLRSFVCTECLNVSRAERDRLEGNQRGPLEKLDTKQLSELLLVAVRSIRPYALDVFHAPVSLEEYPDYKDFVVKPFDLEQLEQLVTKGWYKSVEQFVSDLKWIHHNSVVYNGPQNRISSSAVAMLKAADKEVTEMTLCPQCYIHMRKASGATSANILPSSAGQTSTATTSSSTTTSSTGSPGNGTNGSFFSEVCSPPHVVVWAKIRGFPHWPAKVMRVDGDQATVKFFGDHNKSVVSLNNCTILTLRPPVNQKSKKGSYSTAMDEIGTYVRKYRERFGVDFSYETEQIKLTRELYDKLIRNAPVDPQLGSPIEKQVQPEAVTAAADPAAATTVAPAMPAPAEPAAEAGSAGAAAQAASADNSTGSIVSETMTTDAAAAAVSVTATESGPTGASCSGDLTNSAGSACVADAAARPVGPSPTERGEGASKQPKPDQPAPQVVAGDTKKTGIANSSPSKKVVVPAANCSSSGSSNSISANKNSNSLKTNHSNKSNEISGNSSSSSRSSNNGVGGGIDHVEPTDVPVDRGGAGDEEAEEERRIKSVSSSRGSIHGVDGGGGGCIDDIEPMDVAMDRCQDDEEGEEERRIKSVIISQVPFLAENHDDGKDSGSEEQNSILESIKRKLNLDKKSDSTDDDKEDHSATKGSTTATTATNISKTTTTTATNISKTTTKTTTATNISKTTTTTAATTNISKKENTSNRNSNTTTSNNSNDTQSSKKNTSNSSASNIISNSSAKSSTTDNIKSKTSPRLDPPSDTAQKDKTSTASSNLGRSSNNSSGNSVKSNNSSSSSSNTNNSKNNNKNSSPTRGSARGEKRPHAGDAVAEKQRDTRPKTIKDQQQEQQTPRQQQQQHIKDEKLNRSTKVEKEDKKGNNSTGSISGCSNKSNNNSSSKNHSSSGSSSSTNIKEQAKGSRLVPTNTESGSDPTIKRGQTQESRSSSNSNSGHTGSSTTKNETKSSNESPALANDKDKQQQQQQKLRNKVRTPPVGDDLEDLESPASPPSAAVPLGGAVAALGGADLLAAAAAIGAVAAVAQQQQQHQQQQGKTRATAASFAANKGVLAGSGVLGVGGLLGVEDTPKSPERTNCCAEVSSTTADADPPLSLTALQSPSLATPPPPPQAPSLSLTAALQSSSLATLPTLQSPLAALPLQAAHPVTATHPAANPATVAAAAAAAAAAVAAVGQNTTTTTATTAAATTTTTIIPKVASGDTFFEKLRQTIEECKEKVGVTGHLSGQLQPIAGGVIGAHPEDEDDQDDEEGHDYDESETDVSDTELMPYQQKALQLSSPRKESGPAPGDEGTVLTVASSQQRSFTHHETQTSELPSHTLAYDSDDWTVHCWQSFRVHPADKRLNQELVAREMCLLKDKLKLKELAAHKALWQASATRMTEVVKSKQWCCVCKGLATMTCCWNTSYCSQACQSSHWPVHIKTCERSQQASKR